MFKTIDLLFFFWDLLGVVDMFMQLCSIGILGYEQAQQGKWTLKKLKPLIWRIWIVRYHMEAVSLCVFTFAFHVYNHVCLRKEINFLYG